MLLTIGLLLLLGGVIAIFFGDKDVGSKGGVVLKLFSWPRAATKWRKVAIGSALIYAGIMVVRRALGVE
jgi:hypothetical protein